jgi:hypothetical protein
MEINGIWINESETGEINVQKDWETINVPKWFQAIVVDNEVLLVEGGKEYKGGKIKVLEDGTIIYPEWQSKASGACSLVYISLEGQTSLIWKILNNTKFRLSELLDEITYNYADKPIINYIWGGSTTYEWVLISTSGGRGWIVKNSSKNININAGETNYTLEIGDKFKLTKDELDQWVHKTIDWVVILGNHKFSYKWIVFEIKDAGVIYYEVE